MTILYNPLEGREECMKDRHAFIVKACLSVRVCYPPFVLTNEKKCWLHGVHGLTEVGSTWIHGSRAPKGKE